MLLEIDPADLTEVARKCYHGEVEKRGLTEDDEEPHAFDEAGEHAEGTVEVEPDWLDSAACACSYRAIPGSDHPSDAARARDVLLAEGVPCHLSVVSPDPRNEDSPRFAEYRVLVPGSLNLLAVSILDREIFNAELEADWRAHFAELTDADLAKLTPEVICAGLLDRVKRLRRAYQDEIERRISK